MNMIAGIYKPSKGEVFVNGKKVVFRNPNDAAKCGIGMSTRNSCSIPSLRCWKTS